MFLSVCTVWLNNTNYFMQNILYIKQNIVLMFYRREMTEVKFNTFIQITKKIVNSMISALNKERVSLAFKIPN